MTGVQTCALPILLTNSCSDVLRLLGDVERFGFRLKTLVVAEEDGLPVANIGVSIPYEADASLIATRFARHPEIASVVVHRGSSVPRQACSSEQQLHRAAISEADRQVRSHHS